ncbi:MAG: protein-disulfide reductase DsbD family protein, partial [Thiomicrorhabdus sp.]|nr:protein-disulfide reductase DsbD family protein [Thiomicrorhabdus sp.]
MNLTLPHSFQTKPFLSKAGLFAFFASLLISVGLFSSVNALASDELLEVDQAFVLNQPTINNQAVEVKWDIADDYKLYKDKISVVASNINLEPPQYSKYKTVDDALFGKSDIFEHTAILTIPYTGNATQTELTIKYQGCADKLGVCYPPQTRTFTIDLPAQDKAPSEANLGSLSALNSYLQEDSGQAELLDADDAFAFSHQINANGQLELNWNIAHDYHLYQDKIKVSVLNGDITLGQLNLPKAELIDDELFGKTMVYHGAFSAILPVTQINNSATIQVEYQGCSAASGVCYPPVKKQLNIDASSINASAVTSAQTATVTTTQALSESDQIADTLKNSSVWIVIATFFIFGLLLAFTPCVFPMIPILSSIIVGQG